MKKARYALKKAPRLAVGVLTAAVLLADTVTVHAGGAWSSCTRTTSAGGWAVYDGGCYCPTIWVGWGSNGADRARWSTSSAGVARDMFMTYRHGFGRRSNGDYSADQWSYAEGSYNGSYGADQSGSGCVESTLNARASYWGDDWLEVGSDGGGSRDTVADWAKFYPELDAIYAGKSYESYMYAGNVYQWSYSMNNPSSAWWSWGSNIKFAHTGGVTEGPGWYAGGRVNHSPGTGPGGTMTVYFNMRPTTTGDYNEDFQMVYEGTSWFGDKWNFSNGGMRTWTRLSRKAPGATDGWDNGGKKKGETVRFSVAGADSWGTGSSYAWDWDGSTIQGWHAGNACSVALEDANDRMAISITGGDPYCYSSGGLAINASTCRYLTIRMWANGGSDAQLFWSSSVGGWSGDRHVDWKIYPDGQWHVYRVPLPASWSGTVYQVRLDPVGTGAANGQTVYVDWLRIHHVSDGLSGRIWSGTVHGDWNLYNASAMSWDTGNLCWYQDYTIAHGYPQTYYTCVRVVNNNSQESDNHDRRFGGSGGGTGYRSYKVLNTEPTAANTSFTGNEWSSDNTPALAWSYSDTDSNPQSNYRVQVDDSSGFGSPLIDTQFASGSGTSYAPGSALANGQWYYRVGVLDGLSQSARNGTYTGGVTLGQTGAVTDGTSVSFDGTDDHVVVPSFADSFGSGMTVEFWAYPTANNNWARFMDFGNGPANENILVCRPGTSANLQFEVYNGTVAGGSAISADALINNAWHHYACVLNSDGTVAMYRDGTALTVSGKTVIPNVVTRTINYIGRSNWSADSYYAGRMDEFAIYDRPLTQAEIQAHYNARTSATTYRDHVLAHSPWAYYRLDESSGTTAYNLNGGLGWSSGTAFRVDAAAPTGVGLTIGTVTASSIAVTGAASDAHSGVNASTGYNYSCAGKSDSGWTGTSYTWDGLAANTEYTGLKVTARDQAVSTPNTAASSSQSTWTLSAAPVAGTVTAPAVTYGDNVTWTANGFGPGKVAYYRYVFDQSPTKTSWNNTETQWSSGTLGVTPTAAGTWYLHIKGYNGADVGNGYYDYAVTVNKKALTVTAAVTSKVYDGTTAATITGAALSGVVSGDSVTLGNATSGTFANKNVGTGKTVATAMTLSGASSGNYTLTQPTLTGTITAKALTVTGAAVTSKVYDGTTAATISGAALSGVVSGDTVTLGSAASGTFANKNVGTGKPVTAAMTLNGTDKGNYTLTQPTLTGTITAKALTVTGAAVTSKVYDGTTAATITGAALSGAVSGDSVTLGSATSGTFANKNVGTGKTVATAMTISGTDSGNYTLTQPTLTGTITAKALTVTGAAVTSKVYDGTTAATISGAALSGAVSGDSVTLGSATSGTFANKNVGTGKTVATTMTLSGTDSGNYTLTQPTLTGTITAKALTVTGAAVTSKVYDGTTAATITGAALSGAVSGDSVTLGSATSGTFADKNVGTGKPVTAAMTLSGTDKDNYTLTQPTLTGTITAKALTVTGAAVTSKVYDGTTAATISGAALSGAVSGDSVTLGSATSGTFADKNVGTGKPVTAAMTLNGTDKGNYTLTQPTLTGTITAKALTVTGATVTSKVYDGTTDATISGAALSGAVSGDSVTLGSAASGTFADKNVGTGKTVATAMKLNGTDKGNYTLTQPTLTGTITAKALTVTGATVTSKVYDGTTDATISGAALSGAVSGDSVTLGSATSGTFADKNVGTGKPVTATMTLNGTDKGNYTLTQPTGLTANITPKALTITGLSAVDRFYDGTTAVTVNGTAGLLAAEAPGGPTDDGTPYTGDSVSAGGTATGVFADRNVGTDIAVNISGVTLSGDQSGNYTANLAVTGDILDTKTDASTTTIVDANSENFGLTLNAGTLMANASDSINGSGTVTVNNGGTLGGIGKVGAIAVESGGVLSPGQSGIGTLGVGGNVTLDSGSTTKVEVNRNGGSELSDQVAGIGTFTAGGTLEVTITGDALLPGDEFTLFSAGTYNPEGEFTIGPANPNNDPDLAWDTKALKERGVLGVHRHPKATEVHYKRAVGVSLKILLKPTMYTNDMDGDTVVLERFTEPVKHGVVTTNATRLFYTPVSHENDNFHFYVTDGRGGKGDAHFYVWVTNYVQNLTITETNGSNSVSFYGVPGYEYVIQRSPDIKDGPWSDIATQACPPSGLYQYMEAPPPPPSQVFYRARTP